MSKTYGSHRTVVGAHYGVRDWLAQEPTSEQLQEVFKELSVRDKGAARAIRRLPGYAATPILAMTANVFATDRQTCQAAGMNDHIGKPVDPERLSAMLLRWLDAEDHADV